MTIVGIGIIYLLIFVKMCAGYLVVRQENVQAEIKENNDDINDDVLNV
jgi:hypothetical protein